MREGSGGAGGEREGAGVRPPGIDPSGGSKGVGNGRRFELPEGLTLDEERAIIRALERYFAQESPHPRPWVLAGRVAAVGLGALQARRYTETPWGVGTYASFARRGVPPTHGRADAG